MKNLTVKVISHKKLSLPNIVTNIRTASSKKCTCHQKLGLDVDIFHS